jgi:hypothetical protein
MTKRIAFFIVAIALGLAVAADAGQGTGKISGTARDAQKQALPGVKVQLRNIDTGQLVATSRAANDGAFEFTGLNPGNYAVEIVDNSGKIVGVSPSMALAAAGVIAGVGVAASAAGAAAGAVAAGGAGAFFSSTAGILLLVGAGAGTTAAIIALNDEASPSR